MLRRPFRFAVTAPRVAGPVARWVESVRTIESMGFDTVVIADHFTDGYDTEPMVGLTAAAMATKRLRLQTGVLGVDYRHPVLTHRMAATLDVLSEGRFTLGLGAGWMVSDYEAAGIPYDAPATRVDRLEEVVTILKGLFGTAPYSFTGRHFEIRELSGLPAPVQQPHPPFFIGGGGRRMLGLAGREAAVVGINANLRAGTLGRHAVVDFSADAVHEKIRWARDGAASSGRNPDDFELSLNSWLVRVLPTAAEAEAFLERIAGRVQVPVELLAASPSVLVGTSDQCVDLLVARRETFGVNRVQLDAGFAPDDLAMLEPVVAALAGT